MDLSESLKRGLKGLAIADEQACTEWSRPLVFEGPKLLKSGAMGIIFWGVVGGLVGGLVSLILAADYRDSLLAGSFAGVIGGILSGLLFSGDTVYQVPSFGGYLAAASGGLLVSAIVNFQRRRG